MPKGKMRDVISDVYNEAGNPLDPNNKKIAEGFWTAGQPDKKPLKGKGKHGY